MEVFASDHSSLKYERTEAWNCCCLVYVLDFSAVYKVVQNSCFGHSVSNTWYWHFLADLLHSCLWRGRHGGTSWLFSYIINPSSLVGLFMVCWVAVCTLYGLDALTRRGRPAQKESVKSSPCQIMPRKARENRNWTVFLVFSCGKSGSRPLGFLY